MTTRNINFLLRQRHLFHEITCFILSSRSPENFQENYFKCKLHNYSKASFPTRQCVTGRAEMHIYRNWCILQNDELEVWHLQSQNSTARRKSITTTAGSPACRFHCPISEACKNRWTLYKVTATLWSASDDGLGLVTHYLARSYLFNSLCAKTDLILWRHLWVHCISSQEMFFSAVCMVFIVFF